MNMKILALLGTVAVVLLFITKLLNAPHILATNGASYDPISAVLYVVAGCILVFVAWKTYHYHVVVGIVPFGLGVGALAYGILVLYAKGMLIFG